MNVIWRDEHEEPTGEELQAVRQAVERCRDEGRRVSIETARGDAYAYPSSGGGISCGINGGRNGFCIWQAIAN